jgi:putative ubiquitin-RnfH superfamily antitoxin RatB of RatAB toxin-antitoxin module
VASIRIEVVNARPSAYEQVDLTLPESATVADALSGSGLSLEGIDGYAIFGQCVGTDTQLRDGDRLELLRPLQADPKEARRRRARGR